MNGSPGWRLAVVIDDWPLFRLGLQAILELLGARVSHAVMARDGLRAAAAAGADLVVVGSVNDLTQSEAVHGAKRLSRPPTVVALVGQASRAEVGRLLGAGADALLERSVPAEELAAALRRLAAGERVLAHLAEGRSNQAIAAALHVSPATVKTHLAHIYEKLGASNRNEAVVRAVALGLLR